MYVCRYIFKILWYVSMCVCMYKFIILWYVDVRINYMYYGMHNFLRCLIVIALNIIINMFYNLRNYGMHSCGM